MAEQFTPYVEEENQRKTTQPVSGGMGVNSIKHLTQGVSVNEASKRYGGTMPRVGAGPDNHVTPELVYGQSHLRNETVDYTDQDNLLTGLQFLQDNLGFTAFKVNDSTADGVIEPFVVRDEAAFTTIEQPFVARGISAQLMDGNEDVLRASSRQSQNIPLKFPALTEAFEDSAELFSHEHPGGGGDIALPGYIFEHREFIIPFDDKEYVRLDQKLTANDPELNSVLLQMSGSSQNNIVLPLHKVSSAGFNYFNNPLGTDSLAFGGTLRAFTEITSSSPNGFTTGAGGEID